MRLATGRRREGITQRRGGHGEKEGLGGKRAAIRERMEPGTATTLACNAEGHGSANEARRLLGSSYLIAASIRGGQFKARFFLGIFPQVGGHPDAVALNGKGPFGLLACKTGKLPVSLEGHNCQGKTSSLGWKIKAQEQLSHPRGPTTVKERLLGKLKERLL